jgi:hypothetical protein
LRAGLHDPTGAEKPTRPVARAQPLYSHLSPFRRGVDELVTADRQRHVRRAGCARGEEEQVAGLDRVRVDVAPDPILIGRQSGECDTVLLEDVGREAAAVEAGRCRTAVNERHTAESQRGRGDGVGIGWP